MVEKAVRRVSVEEHQTRWTTLSKTDLGKFKLDSSFTLEAMVEASDAITDGRLPGSDGLSELNRKKLAKKSTERKRARTRKRKAREKAKKERDALVEKFKGKFHGTPTERRNVLPVHAHLLAHWPWGVGVRVVSHDIVAEVLPWLNVSRAIDKAKLLARVGLIVKRRFKTPNGFNPDNWGKPIVEMWLTEEGAAVRDWLRWCEARALLLDHRLPVLSYNGAALGAARYWVRGAYGPSNEAHLVQSGYVPGDADDFPWPGLGRYDLPDLDEKEPGARPGQVGQGSGKGLQ